MGKEDRSSSSLRIMKSGQQPGIHTATTRSQHLQAKRFPARAGAAAFPRLATVIAKPLTAPRRLLGTELLIRTNMHVKEATLDPFFTKEKAIMQANRCGPTAATRSVEKEEAADDVRTAPRTAAYELASPTSGNRPMVGTHAKADTMNVLRVPNAFAMCLSPHAHESVNLSRGIPRQREQLHHAREDEHLKEKQSHAHERHDEANLRCVHPKPLLVHGNHSPQRECLIEHDVNK